MPRTLLATLTNEEYLWGFLEDANGAGDVTGICLPARDANGVPFLASLADDGDSTHVEYVTVGDTGRACCASPDCPYHEAYDWEPKFPVVCLTGGWPGWEDNNA